jgi:hypothetical protein
MRDRFRSRTFPHVSRCQRLLVALGMDFLSSGGRATAFPPDLRRTPDRLPAQPGRLGHARHRGDSPRGALDHLLQAHRAGAGAGHRTVAASVAAGAEGVPDRTGHPDPRRYAGSALREVRAGDQHQTRSQPQGQSADVFEQPVLGHAGLGRARPAGFGADGTDSLLAARRIGAARQALGGTAIDGFDPGAREGGALADRCLVHAPRPDSALARTAGPDHRAGAARYRLVSSARTGAETPRTEAQVRSAGRCGDARNLADTRDGTDAVRQGAAGSGALGLRRGAIPEGAPGASGVVRDVPARPHVVAPTPDSGHRDRPVGPTGRRDLRRALGDRALVSQSQALVGRGQSVAAVEGRAGTVDADSLYGLCLDAIAGLAVVAVLSADGDCTLERLQC